MIYKLNNIKTNKYKTEIVKNNTVIFFKRSLHRVTTKFVRTPVNLLEICNPTKDLIQRKYPGEFRVIRWTNLSTDDKRRLNLTDFELSHYGIEESKTGRIVAVATSSYGKNNPEWHIEKLANEKINGSCIPKLHPITKQPLMDDYGYQIPDPKKGGQNVVVLENQRQVSKDAKTRIEEQKKAQPYIDEYENKLKEILDKNKQRLKLPRKIGGQDDE